MNLSYLSLLALGKVPEENFLYKDLNAARKKRVAGFVNNIPQKYSLDEINSDVQKLSAMKDSFIFKIVDKFDMILVALSVVFFALYWALYGFGYGLLTGGGLLIIMAILDMHLGNLFDLTPSSVQLLTDFDTLLNELNNAQRRERNNSK